VDVVERTFLRSPVVIAPLAAPDAPRALDAPGAARDHFVSFSTRPPGDSSRSVMFSDGESTFGPRKPPDLFSPSMDFQRGIWQIWTTLRGPFRGPGGRFQVPEGHFRGPWEMRQAIAEPFQLNENPLPISAQR
jgi:hypothetical protein